MNDWRSSTIYKAFLIKKLKEDFARKVDKSMNNIYQSKNKFCKSRRAKNKHLDESFDKDDYNSIFTDSDSDSNATKKIRISLNKSRCVIIEK